MGRFAAYNTVCDLLGEPMLPLRIDWYTTILDLGPWSALYSEGWDRQVVAQGQGAKRTKEIINRRRIYPPLSRNRHEILDAGACDTSAAGLATLTTCLQFRTSNRQLYSQQQKYSENAGPKQY
jgi:hypothetical protein